MHFIRTLCVSGSVLLPLRKPPVQAGREMNRRFRTGAVMTLWATYGALWVVAVLMGRPPTTSQGTLRWAFSVVATLFLQGVLFFVGLFMASAAQGRGVRSQRQVLGV
jgi:threonine/homoserine/homoserine lactone efflux protein